MVERTSEEITVTAGVTLQDWPRYCTDQPGVATQCCKTRYGFIHDNPKRRVTAKLAFLHIKCQAQPAVHSPELKENNGA